MVISFEQYSCLVFVFLRVTTHCGLQGHGLMLTDDNSCYEGEFAGITLLQGKVSNGHEPSGSLYISLFKYIVP